MQSLALRLPDARTSPGGADAITHDFDGAGQLPTKALLSRTGQLGLKRFFDISVSAILLTLLFPLLVVIAIAIRLDSPGPALFSQFRWGKDQKKIRVYKFRTMSIDKCDHSGVRQTVPGDNRVTRTGRFLRRTNLDELPQLVNIIKGDMSLVGPRCHPVGMLAAGVPYECLVPAYHDRHAMRPGLTGLAQMRGLRGPTTCEFKARARIENDLRYVRNFTLFFDLKILVGTINSELFSGSGY